MARAPVAVTFDFGQTLAELDHEMLARRASERHVSLDARRLAEETPAAWLAYGAAKRAGLEGKHAWCTFMRTLLLRSGMNGDVDALAEWLFDEQPRKNLWRKPIPGMFELAEELGRSGISIGIVSNSEGKLAELVAELGYERLFAAIADSGKLGIEKPDARIFSWAAAELGTEASRLVHVGDAWEADVVGALEAGARAIWFAPNEARQLPERVIAASDAHEVREALAAFGVVG